MFIEHERHSWQLLRPALMTTVDTVLATFEYENATYVANKWDMPRTANAAAIAFYGTDAANEAATMALFGRAGKGPIMEMWVGAVTLGALVVTKDPIAGTALTAYWGDLITSTGEEWITDIVLRNETEDDKIGYLLLDLPGIKDLYLQFTTKTSVASINGIILPFFRNILST